MDGASVGHLRTIVDGLKIGLVSVDHDLDQAYVNPSAATLLHVSPGTHPASTVAAAMDALANRALNGDEIAAVRAAVETDHRARTDCVWRFADAPTHLRVESMPGPVWAFYDESARAASERDCALLRASLDAHLFPKMVIEAVRDDTGRIVDFIYRNVNIAMCEQLGVPRERLIGRGLSSTLPEFSESGLLDRYVDCVESGIPVVIDDYSYTNTRLGQSRRCDIRTARIDADFLTISWQDATERSELMQRITASEQNFRLLAENIGEVVSRISDDGTITWISKSVEEALGMPAEYFVGRNTSDIVTPDDVATTRQQAAETGEPLVGRAHVSVNGVAHWILFFLKPFYDASGIRDGLVVTFRVIDDEVATEKQVEDARRLQARADARWRRMLDNAAVGMCVSDVSGRLEVVNKAMCDFIGYDEETLKQLTWQELTAPEFLDQDLAGVEYLISGRIDSYRTAKQFIHADGHRVWGDSSLSCLRTPDGDVEAFIAQITDITKEVEALQNLTRRDQQNQAMARQLQEQSDRLESELRSAADYVASILPADLDGSVRVSSRYVPSQALAGDVYDYRWIDDDHLIAYLLDVSGHGIEAALMSVSVHNLLRSGSLSGSVLMQPAQVLAELNESFAMENHAGNYLTMWFGVYEASSGTLSYSSGGHPPALLLPAAQAAGSVTPLSTGGMPVGMFDDSEYSCATVHVDPGDALLLYSDGAYEMSTPDGQTLSLEDFTTLCCQLAAAPGWTLDTLIDELRRRNQSVAFEDDLSLVLLQFGD